MVDARVEAVRKLALSTPAEQWQTYHPSGIWQRLCNKLTSFYPPGRLYVTEHQWDGGENLAEPPIRAWCIDDGGLRSAEINGPQDGELRGMYFSIFSIRFGVSSDARRVLWEECMGPRAGIGFEWSMSDDPQWPKIERSEMVWRS